MLLLFVSYSVDKEHDEFFLNAELSICLPVDDEDELCIPADATMKMVENKHIPACLDKLNEYEGRNQLLLMLPIVT